VALLLAVLPCNRAWAQTYDSALLDGVAARDRALETDSERDWQRALQHFARAMTVQPSKEAAFELAQAAARLNLIAEAYGSYEEALALGLTGKAEGLARRFISENEARVGRIDVRGPPGATLSVDEQPRGELPLPRPLVVLAGERQVSLAQPGFRRASVRVDVSSGSVRAIELELVAERPLNGSSAPLPHAELGPSAQPPLGAPAGHGVTAAQRPEEPSSDAPAWARPTLIAGSALFVTGIAGWVATSLLLSDARGDLRASCSEFSADEPDVCTEATTSQGDQAQSAANRVVTYENLRWVAIGSAGVGLAVAVIGLVPLLTSDSPAPLHGASLEWAPGRIGFAWQQRF
jgi:hypothetical protein